MAPAEVVATYLTFPSEDQTLWWQDTGPLLGRFLEASQYDVHRQYQFLIFFAQHLVPALGPYPQRWRSTISRSGLPIEYSLNFQKQSQRLLRIGFEPVSFLSGSGQDPFNRVAVASLLGALSKLPLAGYDTHFFQRLLNEFALTSREVQELQMQTRGPDTHPLKSQAAFGFDCLPDGRILVKGYVFPFLKAKATGEDVGAMISNTIHAVDTQQAFHQAFSLVDAYMQASTGYNEYTFLSCDCVDLSQQRLKIYGAHTDVTWAKIAEMWTLGGRLIGEPAIMRGLDLLRQLWTALGIDEGRRPFRGGFDRGGSDSAPDQVASPIIWNYEIHRGARFPVPKFYFPVHAENDAFVAQSLARFYESLGWGEIARDYPAILRDL